MQDNNKNNYGFALFIIGLLFFIFGFITWANSQLIPYLKIACQLSSTESYFVTTAFFAAYFFMSIPSSYVLKKTGFKTGMSVGLFVMALGAVLFIPAAMSRSYPIFLTGLFIIGSGLALLQTASNPYAAALGPKESAARRISIMGVCNKLAGIFAVYFLGNIILKDSDAFEVSLKTMDNAAQQLALDGLAHKVILPYIWITIAFAAVGLLLLFIKLPNIDDEEEIVNDDNILSGMQTARTSVWQYPYLIIGVVALFFYVGVEVISYDTFAGFGQYLGYTLDQSKHFATFTGYTLLAGYFVGIATMPKLISQRKALIICVMLSIIFTLLAINLEGEPNMKSLNFWGLNFNLPTHPAVIAFALLGFSNSLMWPAIFPLAIDGLGKHSKMGSALLIMAIVGGAVLPPLYGKLTETTMNVKSAYIIMIPAYLFILYFAIAGYKLGKKNINN
ncbi:MAG TPA: sugar MFS transporter [Edaphocola sp.]|nr:sugar MFS transporter [Edaphocola sp.]